MPDTTVPPNERTVLRESEQVAFLNSILESSTEYSIIAKDLDGAVLAWNEGARRVYGYEAREVIGSANAFILHDPEDVTSGRAQAILDDTRQTGKWEGELRRVRKDGTRFTAHVTITLRRDGTGKPIGFTTISRDLTESQRIQHEVQKSEEKFRHLIEAAPDAMVIVDGDGRIVLVNAQMENLFGYRREELLGKPVEMLIPDRFRATHGGHRSHYAAAPTVRPMGRGLDLFGLRKDGTEFPIESTLSPMESEGRTLVSSAIRDVSDQKRLAEELREAHTRGLIESNIDALMVTDPLGIITDVNRQMCEMTGDERDQLIGTPFKNYFTDPRRAEDGIRQVLAEDRVTNYELTMRARNGRETVISCNATTFRGVDGRVRGVFAAARDITEQKVLEEQLRRKNEELEEQYRRVQEANRLKSEFLANMSHELRTPLNGIIGFAELMHDGKLGPISSEQKEYMGDILTSARHLLQLINDVLDLSKVESGKMEFHPERVDIAGLVGEVRDILRTLAAQKRIRVDTQIDPAVTGITLDPSKLKQILYNYLSNALKFTPDEGTVTIRVAPEGPERFRLEVQDTGIGIRPEDMDRLFTQFQQLDASTTKKYPGTGLGLALTKHIVEAQGGHPGARSIPGAGSVFFAVLPRVAAPVGEPEPEAVLPRGGAPRILVVDDDAKDRAWLARTLGDAGYAVKVAATGKDAIAQCRKTAFDAITLDLLLPDIGGREVLAAVRAGGPNANTPVVVVSVAADKTIGVGFHVNDILSKPVPSEVLLAALQRAHVTRSASRPILVVDDDPQALKLAERTLKDLGYRPVCRSDAEGGLHAAEHDPPAAVILDLLMPEVDGFEFLKRFRQTATGRRTPVIVWTVKDLSRAERDHLKASAHAVVAKSQGATALLDELRGCVPLPAASARAEESQHGR